MLEALVEYSTKLDWYRLRFHARSTESYNPNDYSEYENYDSYLTSCACLKGVRAIRSTHLIEKYEVDISLSLPFDEQFDTYRKQIKIDFENKRNRYLACLEYMPGADEMFVTDHIKESGGRKAYPFKEWERLIRVYDLHKKGLTWAEISKDDAVGHYKNTKSKTAGSSAGHLTKRDFNKAVKLIQSAASGTFPKIS